MNTMAGISQNKIVRVAIIAIAILVVPTLAHAQSGCTDSPENPTALLAVVGCAGACFTSVRRHIKARRDATRK